MSLLGALAGPAVVAAVIGVKAWQDKRVADDLGFNVRKAKVRWNRRKPLDVYVDVQAEIQNKKDLEVRVDRIEGSVTYGSSTLGSYQLKDGLVIAAGAVTPVAIPVKVSVASVASSILAAVAAKGPITIKVLTAITWNGVTIRLEDPYTIGA